MSLGFHEFMFEWGPIVTGTVCLICGFCYGWIYAVAAPQQRTLSYIVVLFVILACVLSAVLFENIPGHIELRGQFVQKILLGIPMPLLAGIGIFAWSNPGKWIVIAEDRKYKKDLRSKM